MENEILSNLNEEQKLPASTIYGPVLVTAGAGSGKTRMLTHRIAYMVKSLNISPANILAITFTNKAANEMKERLATMIDGINDMWVCTFHAMCSKILRYNISLMGYTSSFSIYGEVEKNRTIKRILENKKTEINAETFAWHISNAKNNLFSPEKYSSFIRDKKKCEIITTVYSEYEQELKKANALDFDDLLVKTYELLIHNPDTLNFYQNKFRFIHVDEFQDTNTAQYKLIKLLAGDNNNVFAVGDEDQCIYSWRGAEVANVKQFTIDFEGCKVFKLEQNYRSTKKIIALANKLIKNNSSRIEKNLWTNNEDGAEVELKQTYNDIEEAEFVAEKISSLVENGQNYKDFAILMRVNALSRILEEKLLTYNIPYKIYGGFKFFERKEIKDTVAYLHILTNPNDTDATIRMLGFPKKGIGDVTIAEIERLAEENNVSMMDIINNPESFNVAGSLAKKLIPIQELFVDLNEKMNAMPLDEFASYLVEKVQIKEAIGSKTEEDENKCLNIDDFVKSITEFTEANEGAGIDEFLQSITLMRDIDNLDDEENYVTLMTIHSAKGLEFNNVFLVGLNDGLFPLSRAINSTDPNDLEEERRLMYVAVTRAKKRLYLSRQKVKFNYESKRMDYTNQSRFLEEMFDELKNKKQNSSIFRTNLDESGFGNTLSKASQRENLAQNMASHINVVNVSGTINATVGLEIKTSQKISPSDYSKFKTGVKVSHPHFGDGVITLGVTDFASAFVTIKFEKVGIKTLSLKYASLEIID